MYYKTKNQWQASWKLPLPGKLTRVYVHTHTQMYRQVENIMLLAAHRMGDRGTNITIKLLTCTHGILLTSDGSGLRHV